MNDDSSLAEEIILDRIAELPAEETVDDASGKHQELARPKTYARDWSQHPLNVRVSLPLPFSRWYVTLVAGKEKRCKERLIEERKKHPLETMPNLLFLLSVGIFTSALILIVTALILIHGFGWSIQLSIPA